MIQRNLSDDATLTYLFRRMHPVGECYATVSPENPGKTFGGKWELDSTQQLQSGKDYYIWVRTS